uniref:Trinucleotide repeat containing adaptor 6C n=1 Tax=Molossus molossus TaxID=27622 RepID=A0A7J8D3A2_MOLMO|nr:trinucleotide repeat containing adaptor 6C [Molossus molossus]
MEEKKKKKQEEKKKKEGAQKKAADQKTKVYVAVGLTAHTAAHPHTHRGDFHERSQEEPPPRLNFCLAFIVLKVKFMFIISFELYN